MQQRNNPNLMKQKQNHKFKEHNVHKPAAVKTSWSYNTSNNKQKLKISKNWAYDEDIIWQRL